VSSKRNRFAGVKRGKPLRGSKAVARHIWNDEKKRRSAFRLDREQLGLSIVVGELFGYSGWIDHGLAEAAAGGKRRQQQRKERKAEVV